jgi:hypothetical protein
MALIKAMRLLGIGYVYLLGGYWKQWHSYCVRMAQMITETARKRLEIINFYKTYGLKPTLEAFKVSIDGNQYID